MSKKLQDMLEELRKLENSVEEEVRKAEKNLLYEVKKKKVIFEKKAVEGHKRLKKSVFLFLKETSLLQLLASPLIYFMFFPALLLDITLTIIQYVAFPIYGIKRAKRSEYIVLDRHKLNYLNAIEKFNCVYCGYFNGVMAYAYEIASRAEEYWCPIKHALRVKGLHSRHRNFLPYGDPIAYKKRVESLLEKVKEETKKIEAGD